MTRPDLDTVLSWMHDGTARFEAAVDALTDDELSHPSVLPGWTRAHVVGHVGRNADALVNLLTWAATGVETPMYVSMEQRSADIEHTAARPPAELRADLLAADSRLGEAARALPAAAWSATVRSARGRDIPGAEAPWMRVKEVWIHAADLNAPARFDDLPAPLVDALLDDVAAALSARDGCPAVRLAPTDRNRHTSLGGGPAEVEVRGTAADLLGWLTGRSRAGLSTTADELPDLPRWL